MPIGPNRVHWDWREERDREICSGTDEMEQGREKNKNKNKKGDEQKEK